jgi:hypothetical protein
MYKTDFHVIELQSTIYIRDIKNNRDNIGYAEHILNTRHLYGTIQDTMEIIKAVKKRTNNGYNRKIPHIQSKSEWNTIQ